MSALSPISAFDRTPLFQELNNLGSLIKILCEQPTNLSESVVEANTSTVKAIGDTLDGAVAQFTFDNLPAIDAKQTKKLTKLGRFEIHELLGAGAINPSSRHSS